MLRAVGKKRTVREIGDWIVEGLVRELVFEFLPLADVAAVEDDASYMFVLQEVGVLHLELQPGAVAVLEPTLDHVRFGATADVRLADTGKDLHQTRLIGWREQPREVRSLELIDAVTEHARDRRALIRHRPVGVEHGDEVARVGYE